jgi:hypothetical protein
VRPHQRQHVGEAGDLQAEIGARTIGPLVLEAQPGAPADVDAVEGASDGIQAGDVDDHVELMLGIAGFDAAGRDPFDRMPITATRLPSKLTFSCGQVPV